MTDRLLESLFEALGMFRRNQPLKRAARFFRSEMAGTVADHAIILGCIVCMVLTTMAFLGENVNRSFDIASRRIGAAVSGFVGGDLPETALVQQTAPEEIGEHPRTPLASEHLAILLAMAAVIIAFLGSRLARPRRVRKGQKEDEEEREQGPGEPYIYLRRQKILQKLFNNTAVLFKCRLQVRDLMSEEVQTVPPHTKMADLVKQMAQAPVPHVFVATDDGRLLGIIHRHDLSKEAHGKAKDIMTTDLSTVRPEEPLTHAISMILNEDRWTLPVAEEGRLRGEITRTDLAITLQCVFQVFLRIGQFAETASVDEDNVSDSVRATLSTQREKLNELSEKVFKHDKKEVRGPWRNICREAEELLETNKRLAHDVEKAADGLDHRMQNLMTLFVPRIDALTGLCTRKGLEETLESMCAMNRRYGQSVSLMLVRFSTNGGVDGQSNGPASDERLRKWGKWLDRRMRETDIVGRYNDEAFGIVLPHTDQEGARLCQTRLEQEFSKSPLADDATSMIAGIATASAGTGSKDLMKRAEEALAEVPIVNAS